MKILILTNYYEEGPSSRYRSFNYKKYFLKNNIIPEYKPLFDNGYVKNLYSKNKNNKMKKIKNLIKRVIFLLKNKKKYDHIIIETEVVKFFPYFLEWLLLKGSSYSLDYDDNPNFTYKKNKVLNMIYGNKINQLAKNAKFVTVGNKWYYKEIKGSNLKYLPTVIDKDKYFVNVNKKNKKIVIVWIGSPSTEKYLELIKEPLKKISFKYDTELKLIGSNKKMDGINIKNIKWDEKTEIKEISNSDIGIMPLEDTYWEKGKCGFKLIQYMGCGLPVIASPAPANEEIIVREENGFIAKNEKEWYEYLEKLIEDNTLRKKMGRNSRKIVEDRYCYQVWGNRYAKMIREVKNDTSSSSNL